MNVPEGMTAPDLRKLRLHPARPPGCERADRGRRRRRPTRCLRLLASAGSKDDAAVAACSPAAGRRCCRPRRTASHSPAKLAVTKLLSRCGATISEAELRPQAPLPGEGRAAGRGVPRPGAAGARHLGRGRRPARRDRLRPDCPRTQHATFAEALAVFDRYGLRAKVPPARGHRTWKRRRRRGWFPIRRSGCPGTWWQTASSAATGSPSPRRSSKATAAWVINVWNTTSGPTSRARPGTRLVVVRTWPRG